MAADIKLLSLPEPNGSYTNPYDGDDLENYARANMEPLLAEVKALRAEARRVEEMVLEQFVAFLRPRADYDSEDYSAGILTDCWHVSTADIDRALRHVLAPNPVRAEQPKWMADLRHELQRSKMTHNFTLTRDELGLLMKEWPWYPQAPSGEQPEGKGAVYFSVTVKDGDWTGTFEEWQAKYRRSAPAAPVGVIRSVAEYEAAILAGAAVEYAEPQEWRPLPNGSDIAGCLEIYELRAALAGKEGA